ncbi:MAG TPA: hypothetical protein VGJ05_16335 [Fimbriiglobus sp.]
MNGYVKKYGYERLEFSISSTYSSLKVRGDKEAVDWATGIVAALMKK